VHRLDALVQAVFVVLVLALEMLRTQQQALAPKYFAVHVAFPPVESTTIAFSWRATFYRNHAFPGLALAQRFNVAGLPN
jgi:hypothetical protein